MDLKRQSLSLKFVVVGDPMVGKTSLLVTYTRNFFCTTDSLPPTVAEKYHKEIVLDDHVKLLMSLWDTPSMDGYENFRKLLYPLTNCFILCYALNNPSSFYNVESLWLPEIFENNSEAVIILVGTKSDLGCTSKTDDKKTSLVCQKKVAALVEKYKMDASLQCSSLVPETVEKVFRQAIDILSIQKSS